MRPTLEIRRAMRGDRDALHALQKRSLRVLGAAWYEPAVIEAFLAHVGTMDDARLDVGTFFAASRDGRLVGCGGWSMRRPNYAAQMQAADAAPSGAFAEATVRSIFVDPAFARNGIAREIMAVVEADILAAGFRRAVLTATLAGVPFYRRLGYRDGAAAVLGLPGGLQFFGVTMDKPLLQEDWDAAA